MKGKNLLAMAGLGLVALSVRSLFEGAMSPVGRERAIGSGGGVVSPLLNPALCARADRADQMQRVVDLGAATVRVFAAHEEWADSDAPVHRAVDTAEDLGLSTMAVVAPTEPLSKRQAEAVFRTLLTRNQSVKFVELLNEYDDSSVERWQDQDPAAAARFIDLAIEIITSARPGVDIVVGAQVDPANNFERLIYELAVRGVKLESLWYAAHIYDIHGASRDVSDKLRPMEEVMDQWKMPHHLMITEVGVNSPVRRGQKIVSLIQEAREFSGQKILTCIHEAQQSPEGWTVEEDAALEIRQFAQGE